MEEIDKRFAFCGALFGIEKKDIKISATRRRSNLSPVKFFELVKTKLTVEGRTSRVIQLAQSRSLKISQHLPLTSSSELSSDHHSQLMHMVLSYEWKIGQIIHNGKCSSKPLHVALFKVTERFVNDWNSSITDAEGKWLYLFGCISSNELVIQNLEHFISLLEEGQRQKIYKNMTRSKDEYRKMKRDGQVLIHHLKLFNLSKNK